MDYQSFPDAAPRRSRIDRIQAFFEVLLLSGLVSSFAAALIFSAFRIQNIGLLLTKDAQLISFFLLLESARTFVILAIVLSVHRETLGNLGLRRDYWKRNAFVGLALVPLLFLINAVVAYIFKVCLPKYYIEENPLTQMIQTPQQLALFIAAALIAGGIKEELQRAFILNRFRTYLGGAGVGLVIWSIAFGAGHYVQGVQGVVIAAMYGFFFGAIYLLSGSLIAPIVAHGVYDTLALLAYWFFADQMK
jgi:membrane protease YdiL (CAAX protease family)